MERTGFGDLMTPEAVCELIPGMSKQKLAQLRFTGDGPAYYKPTPKTVVYSRAQVLAWLEGTMRQGTAFAEVG